MHMDDKFSLKLSQEEGILLLTSARLLDKLVAGVTIHAKERDELIREIIDKLSMAVSPELASMSDELANAIVESVLGCDEQDDDDFCAQDCISDFVEVTPDCGSFNYPMYAVDGTLPVLENAQEDHLSVTVQYYSFARESVDKLTLNPLNIKREEGLWRMIAYCHELDEVMIFRVDRIKELERTAKRFEMPREFSSSKNATFAAYR
jgi:hypothetical protein